MDTGILLLFDGQPGNTLRDCPGIARDLEDMGFRSLWMPDHVVTFKEYEPNYPYDESGVPPWTPQQGWHNPLFSLAAAASTTSTIRLGTGIVILPERNPLILAQEAVALDHISNGRFDLGVGIGWCPEEFAALGVPFERRGARADEYIEVMRRLWNDDIVSFDGEFVSFQDVVALPKPVQHPGVPVIVGGNSPGALRRAARLGDGWISWMVPVEHVQGTVDALRRECEAAGRDPEAFRKVLAFFYSTPAALEQYMETCTRAGVTEIVVAPWVPDRDPGELLGEIAKVSGTGGVA